MKFAIYGSLTKHLPLEHLLAIFHLFDRERVEVRLHEPYAEAIKEKIKEKEGSEPNLPPTFKEKEEIQDVDYIFSIGGDGTMLRACFVAVQVDVPVIGVNVGRLGFLTNFQLGDIKDLITILKKGKILLDERTMIQVESNQPDLFQNENYGLNDVTLHKSDTNEMIHIKTYIDGEFLNSLWADGLIIATPTGSTAYSLSCGGPIIAPRTGVFVMTPIAPHSLSARPFVFPDRSVLSFVLESRNQNFYVAIDNRIYRVPTTIELAVKRSEHQVKIVNIPNGNTFYKALRAQLNWGQDVRH
jgi:NAD+ kinase